MSQAGPMKPPGVDVRPLLTFAINSRRHEPRLSVDDMFFVRRGVGTEVSRAMPCQHDSGLRCHAVVVWYAKKNAVCHCYHDNSGTDPPPGELRLLLIGTCQSLWLWQPPPAS